MNLHGIHIENWGRTNGGTTLEWEELILGPLNPYASKSGITNYMS